MANPNIRILYITIINVKLVEGPTSIKVKEEAVMRSNPPITNHLAPIRSKIRPMNGDINPVISAPGSIANPASNAVNPRMFCINSGMSVSAPIRPIKVMAPIMIAIGNNEYVNTRNSSIGCFNRNCLLINQTSEIVPMPRDMIVLPSVQP
ncbi:hypothetical protein SRABI84_04431 [Peribacillus simplex]|nr:hypothetical protein SRABI84_04431 [Peribacillus simplex]